MKYIKNAALLTIGLLLAIYIARNEIISLYFSNIYPLGKTHKIKLSDPYISFIPPTIQFKELEIYDIKNEKTLFLMERFKLEAQWCLNKNQYWKINKITAHIRQWQITRDANGKTSLDWILALGEKYNTSLSIDELNLSARGVVFIDYVFSEDGLTIRQPPETIESITLYSVNGNIIEIAAWVFPKLWFDIPFTLRKIASARRPVSHLRFQDHAVRIYTDEGAKN